MKMKMAHSARLDICSHSLNCPTPAFKALQNYTTNIIASHLNLAKVIGQVAVFLVMAGILTCLLVMLHWHHNSQPNAGHHHHDSAYHHHDYAGHWSQRPRLLHARKLQERFHLLLRHRPMLPIHLAMAMRRMWRMPPPPLT